MRLSLGLFLGFLMATGGWALPPRADSITLVSTSVGLKPLFEALVPVYAEVGLRAVYEELPASRLNVAAQTGEADAIIAVSEGFQKALVDHYLALGKGKDPLGVSNLCQYLRKEDVGKFLPDPKTWGGRTVGVIASVGPNLTDAYMKNVSGVSLMTAPSYSSLVKMLDGYRFDFFLSTQGAVEPEIEAAGLTDHIVRVPKPLLTVRYYHALNRRFEALAPALSEAILKHQKEIDAAVDALVNR
jgi:hypothetical protein